MSILRWSFLLLIFVFNGFSFTASAQADTVLARQYFTLGQDYLKDRACDSAIAYLELAEPLFSEAQAWPALSDTYFEIGRAWRYQRTPDRLQNAIHFLGKAVDIADQHCVEDAQRRGRNYEYYGFVHRINGNSYLALRYYKLYLEQLLTGSDRKAVASVHQNIGNQYSRLGDYKSAIRHLDFSFTLFDSIYGVNHFHTARCAINLGRAYFLNEDFPEVGRYYRLALKVRQQIIPDRLDVIGYTYEYLSQYYFEVNQPDSANYCLDQMAQILKKLPDETGLRISLLRLRAKYAKANGRPAIALEHLNELTRVYESDSQRSHRAYAQHLITRAEVQSSMGLGEEAAANYQAALEQFFPEFEPASVHAMPELNAYLTDPWVMEALKGKAQVFRERYNHSGDVNHLILALEHYDLAHQQILYLRQGFLSESARLELTARIYAVYEEGVSTAVQIYQVTQDQSYLEKAFELMEESKSVSFMEVLAVNKAQSQSEGSEELFQSIRWLENEIRDYQHGLHVAPKDQLEKIKAVLFDLEEQRDEQLRRLSVEHPLFHSLKYQRKSLPLSTVQQSIGDPNTLMVEYLLGDKELITLAIHRDAVWATVQPIAPDLISAVASVRKSLSHYPKTSAQLASNYANYGENAFSLYQQLLQPLEEASPLDQNEITTLVIVTDGVLNYLPFEALLNQAPPATVAFDELSYLLHRYRVRYAMSATALCTDRPTEPAITAAAPIAAFGLSFENFPAMSESLPAIPFAAEEAQRLHDLYEATLDVDQAAQLPVFRERLSQHAIVHLATHSYLDSTNPLYSRLLFYPDEASRANDLHTYELYNMSIPTDLIVLSACRTGDGNLIRGEGIQSFARGFRFAGCNTVITSLWNLNDQGASKTMRFFYDHLNQGQSIAGALHASKKQYLSQANASSAHPYFWANFVVIGKDRSFELESASISWYWLVLAGVLTLLLAFALRKRFNKQA